MTGNYMVIYNSQGIEPVCKHCDERTVHCICDGKQVCAQLGCKSTRTIDADFRQTYEYRIPPTYRCDEHTYKHFDPPPYFEQWKSAIDGMWEDYVKLTPKKQIQKNIEIENHFRPMYSLPLLVDPYGSTSSSSKYLITFTKDDKKIQDNQKWLDRVKKELSRKVITKYITGSLEHEGDNIHFHAYVECKPQTMIPNRTAKKYTFHSFEKLCGHVDVKHVKTDNGISEYMENPFKRIEDIKLKD